MTITELCAHVGDENIQCQGLSSSLIRATMKATDGEITFATDREKVAALAGVGAAHGHHPNFIAVFLAEQGLCPDGAGVVRLAAQDAQGRA